MRPPAVSQGPFRHPLSTALRSEAGVRVLRELALHGDALDASRVMRATHLTRQTVLSTLGQLVELRLVTPIGGSRSRSYRLDAGHPLAPALTALFAAETARADRVLDGVRRAARAMPEAVRAVWLYGSVARGDDVATSDVDVAVVVASPARLDDVVEAFRDRLRDVEAAEYVVTSVVGLADEDVRRLSRGDPWWSAVEREAIPLVGDAPAEYARRVG